MMNIRTRKISTIKYINYKRLGASLLALSLSAMNTAIAQQPQPSQIPSHEALNKAMQDAQKRASTAIGNAPTQTPALPAPTNGFGPSIDPRTSAGIDPAAIAEQYKNLTNKAPNDSEAPPLLIFVSTSMPEESLRRIGLQAKQAGAVVVFRGLKNGMRKGAWADSMAALKPIADTGADIQIHPELFRRYHVTVVPTLVVSAAPQSGCQDDTCAAKSAQVLGDVSLDYALERLADRTDAIGKIAKERLKRLRKS
jgi:conjugal transfer pilus assembly protein TrbC